MRYAVIWLHSLNDRLADVYLQARRRRESAAAVTAASARIDSLLRRDPLAVGESRGPDYRMLIDPPLSVTYEVHEEERVVAVVDVRYLSRR
jgi:hypothetical protein